MIGFFSPRSSAGVAWMPVAIAAIYLVIQSVSAVAESPTVDRQGRPVPENAVILARGERVFTSQELCAEWDKRDSGGTTVGGGYGVAFNVPAAGFLYLTVNHEINGGSAGCTDGGVTALYKDGAYAGYGAGNEVDAGGGYSAGFGHYWNMNLTYWCDQTYSYLVYLVPKEPLPVAPTPPGMDPNGDEDGDGVRNADDLCPGTAPGVRIGADGCRVRPPPTPIPPSLVIDVEKERRDDGSIVLKGEVTDSRGNPFGTVAPQPRVLKWGISDRGLRWSEVGKSTGTLTDWYEVNADLADELRLHGVDLSSVAAVQVIAYTWGTGEDRTPTVAYFDDLEVSPKR